MKYIMNHIHVMYKPLAVLALLSCSLMLQAQTASDSVKTDPNLSKIVHVVTEFEPTINDANRITVLPQVKDTAQVKPAFNYSIQSVPAQTTFETTPINAAKMKGEPLTRLYRAQFTGGLGNKNSTLARLSLSTLRSTQYSLIADFDHNGTFSTIKVGSNKEPAHMMTNKANIQYVRFLKDKELYITAKSSYDLYDDYGHYPTEDIQYSSKQIASTYNFDKIDGGLRSITLDSNKVKYDINPYMNYFTDLKNSNETNPGVNAILTKNIGESKADYIPISADFRYDFFANNGAMKIPTPLMFCFCTPSSSNIVEHEITLNPFAQFNRSNMRLKVGFAMQLYAGDYQKFKIYPDVALEYNPFNEAFIPFIAATGFSNWSGMAELARENPYVNSGLYATPEIYTIKASLGFKGLASKLINYNASVNVSHVDNMHFFVPNVESELNNQFTIDQDNVNIVNVHAELGIKKIEKIQTTLKADYNYYNLETLPYAWGKPKFDMALNVKYDLQKKIVAHLDLFYVGQRYAHFEEYSSFVLPAYFDANIGLEYRYTKRLSAFLNCNNIASKNYQVWAYYPVQRFNAMLGFSYAFWGE